MPIAPITTNGPTITVSNLQELKDAYYALSHQNGGGTILLEPGSYGHFEYYNYGENYEEQPVIIKSADPSDPAHLKSVYLREVSNVRIENVHFDSTGDSTSTGDLFVSESNNIQVVDSTFIHDADGSLKAAGEIVHEGVRIRHSEDIVFENNYLSGYSHGIGITSLVNAEINGNELTEMQMDGIRGGGLDTVSIDNNYLHGFIGVDSNLNHDDMIQIWGANTDILTQNLSISGNVILGGESAGQSIFVRNEEFYTPNDPTSGYYKNVVIKDNLIYNGHTTGISVDDVDGLIVDNNTVLFNPDAWSVNSSGQQAQAHPVIVADNSLDVQMTNNIATRVTAPEGSVYSGNETVTYTQTGAWNYAGRHFVDIYAGKDATIEDLAVLPSSPWFGTTGSPIGNDPADVSEGVRAVVNYEADADDRYLITVDASASFDSGGPVASQAGYSFHWTFADGSTATGTTHTKQFDGGGFEGVTLEIRQNGSTVAEIDRNLIVQTKDIFAFDFQNGAVDVSDADPTIIRALGETVTANGSTGYLVGDGRKLEIDADGAELSFLDTFGIAFDLTASGDEKTGTFLDFNNAMNGQVMNDGTVQFTLITDQGTFEMLSREPIFDDDGSHRIGIAYNGKTGQMEMFADGENVSSVEAWGTTFANSKSLVFGNTWGDSMDAVFDNIVMSVDPSVAGDLAAIDPVDPPSPPPPPPPPPPPADDPVDPPADDPVDPPADDPVTPPADDPVDPPSQGGPDNTPDAEPTGTPRGKAPEAIEGSGRGNILSEFFDFLLSIFGLDSDDKVPVRPATSDDVMEGPSLSDVVPDTGPICDGEMVSCDEEDDDLTDLAA